MALAQPTPEAARAGFRATFVSLYLTWNAATVAGAVGAQARLARQLRPGRGRPGRVPWLLWPRLREGHTERLVALGGAVIAVAATPFCPPGIPVILAAAAALAAGLPWPPRARQRAARARWLRHGGSRHGGSGHRGSGTAAAAVTGAWVAVLVTAGGCYALKLAGLAVPARWLDHPRPQRFATLVPVALLAGLIAVQATAAAGPSPWTRPCWPAWARRSWPCCCASRSCWSSWRRRARRQACRPSAQADR